MANKSFQDRTPGNQSLRPNQGRWNRIQSLALSAQFMRDVLEDLALSGHHPRLAGLDRSLKSLGRLDPFQSRIVELHLAGGLSIKETAAVLRTSEESVLCSLALAEEWLACEMGTDSRRTETRRLDNVLVMP